ncbi:MAG: spermidine/putrescine ABC transporter substrate-binding protein [Firmicutes bacterium]|nr:spermidine/putrescine ABC transporter substrate-binding protein [Bacillota bacterium]
MKKVLTVLAVLLVLALLTACGSGSELDTEALTGTYTRDYAGTTLNVFNWGEYISDGSEGSLDVNAAFEELTGVKVNYANFESNEAMYAKLKSGAVSYDVIIPSDYMIQRLINENMLRELDYSFIDNAGHTDPRYLGLYFDPEDAYSVPYMVGTVGLIYNTTMVEEPPTSWRVMWDERYTNDILTFNNSRDAFSIAQLVLGQDVNSTDRADWDAAADLLKQQNKVLQGRVMDEVFNKMEAGNAAICAYYAGDYLIMVEENEDLAFVYPEEGTTAYIDSACVPANCQNYEAALMYINFLLEPQVALANAEEVVYTSPNLAVQNDDNYTYKDDPVLYGDLPPVQWFTDLPADVRSYYEGLWEDILLYSE